ncbi:MAG: hypothetical protein JST32_07635 [Bacteroidetes bacterium]|nr:hypothetical protein [Bacteroidota bacterium]
MIIKVGRPGGLFTHTPAGVALGSHTQPKPVLSPAKGSAGIRCHPWREFVLLV